MDENNMPNCSREPDPFPTNISQHGQSNDLKDERTDHSSVETPNSFIIPSTYSYTATRAAHVPLIIRPSFQSPITSQPRMSSNLLSPTSLNSFNQPQSLFLQALTKINENSLTCSLLNQLKMFQPLNFVKLNNGGLKSGEITPPDSLASAPPSYSFVLRQMAVRRRPRLMGTFIPSPSFVQHTPPPTYATAFDIYIDNPIPPPPVRVYTFGFASMPVVCPECGFTGMTVVNSKITICTHLCAFTLCLFCCWVCAPLPYVLRSCKDVYHYCRNCRNFLGLYCPTNPEHSYS